MEYKPGMEVVRTKYGIGMRGILLRKIREGSRSWRCEVTYVPSGVNSIHDTNVGQHTTWSDEFFELYAGSGVKPNWEI